jgi:rifampicin phosphotransferase
VNAGVRGASDPHPREEVGGKAHHLARLREAGADVPPWITVDAAAFDRAVAEARREGATGPDALRAALLRAELPPRLLAALAEGIARAGLGGLPLAVRSSALAEDGTDASFAGQFETVLGVVPAASGAPGDGPPGAAALPDAVRRVWASALGAHALAYAARAGAGTPRMGVVVQAMVDAVVAGVVFSADPVGDPGTAVVSAVPGLGEALVSGEVDADTYRVDAAGDVRVEVAAKERALRLVPGGGTRWVELDPGLRAAPALTDGEAREIADAARRLAERFGAPQDVEWAIERAPDGSRRLRILQARPITALGPAAVAPTPGGGERRLWDNSNIVESFGGVTLPLTFSFARGVYEEVYLQFCRVLGVSEPLLAAHRHVFANMLGLVRGRVYYNLLNWYRVLALLPGYTVNRDFMERMMGVRERLADPPSVPPVAGRGEDAVRTARMAWRLVRAQRSLRRGVPAFHARVDAALAPLAGADLAARPADELAALYRRLEEDLLRHWRAPLVNDFFAMISFGVLVRLVERWLPGAPPATVNDLLCGEGGIVSTEPARLLLGMAARVRDDSAVAALLEGEDGAESLARLAAHPGGAELHADLAAYLERFGDRCASELKLETVTHRDDPSTVVRLLREYARGGVRHPDGTREVEVRAAAERLVRARLRGPRRRAFMAVLGQARARIRDRENLRFERTRVFGAVRRILLAIGGRLAEAGRLDEARDVLYLRVEEVFAHLDGTGVTADLRALAALRRREFDAYAREPALPERFETFGPPGEVPPAATGPDPGGGDGGTLRGTGCSPGVVRAPVRVVRDPHAAGELTGHILVAERTDPGWTLLFPAALGVLVERGSLLSHSAIVARELALPCIVSIPGLIGSLRDGERVEMDGTAGTVRRLEGEGGGA